MRGEGCSRQQALHRPSGGDPRSSEQRLVNGQPTMAQSKSNGLRATGSKRSAADARTSFSATAAAASGAPDSRPKMTIAEGWNPESTRTLCDIMLELKEEEEQHQPSGSQCGNGGNGGSGGSFGGDPFALPEPLFWVKAALKMSDRGYFFSSAFLRERWKQLTERYQSQRSRRQSGGVEAEDSSSSTSWDLFPTLDAFHKVVAKRRRRHAAPTSPTSPRQQQMLPFVTCSLLDEAAASVVPTAASSRSEDRSSSDDDIMAAADSGDSQADTSWDRRHHSLVIDESAGGSDEAPDSPVDSKAWFVGVTQRMASAAAATAAATNVANSEPPSRNADVETSSVAARHQATVPPSSGETSSAPPDWFVRYMTEFETRVEQRVNRALEKHTSVVQEMHETLKELLIRCVYAKSRPS